MKTFFIPFSLAFLMSSLMVLATTDKANSLSLSRVRFVSNIDDKILFGSSLEITGDGNIYAVDGFNNTLQALNPTTPFLSSRSNDGQFRWTKLTSIDKTGNIYRSSQISYKGSNSVYIVDGINNQLQTLTTDGIGNIHLLDGINNSIQAFNNTSNIPESDNNNTSGFNWLKTLKIDNDGQLDQTYQIEFTNANYNFYGIDGFNKNNQVTLDQSKLNARKNFYLGDGINNIFKVLPNDLAVIDLFEKITDESNSSWQFFFNNSNNTEGNINLSNIFKNLQLLNNGKVNLPKDFASNLLANFRTGIESLLGENTGLTDLNFYENQNINIDNAHSIYIVDGINNKIQAWENPLTNITDQIYLTDGLNPDLEILAFTPENGFDIPDTEDSIAVPEPSQKLSLFLFFFGAIAYGIQKKIVLR